jgi:PilZ domain/GYF domain 2
MSVNLHEVNIDKTTLSSNFEGAEWYVLKGKERFGPYGYTDVIHMLQDKSVFEFDFAWCKGMESWKRIAELSIFSQSKISELFGKTGTDEKVFFRRHYVRGKCNNAVVIHDNSKIWKGKAVEMSEGGAGVIIENALLMPGQNIYIHFKGAGTAKPFNVLCEIVSKEFKDNIQHPATAVKYGVKFINIQKQDREAIRTNIAA